MPEMDGVQATRLIRQQNEWNARMPILALTADTRMSDLGAEETKLFTQRISKPFDPDYLYKLLLSLLPNLDQSSAQEKHAEAASAPTKEVDFSKIEAQFGKKDVIMRFLSKAQKALSEFQDNYFKGMRAADKPVISDAVHKAKVLFDMLGLLDLHQQISDARELLKDGENREALGSVLQSFEEKLEKVQQELQAYQHKLQDS